MDYTGFTYGGYHSRDLGIIRVSDGSRYQRALSAPFKETVLQIPGSDVSHFLEAHLEPRDFVLDIVYNKLTERQVSVLGKLFNGRELYPLIFDELPFKAYFVTPSQPIELSYIPFEDREYGRIYKGEGSINLRAYDPLAVSVGKYLEDFPLSVFPNRAEWASASRMKETKGSYDQAGNVIPVYNAGDEKTDLKLYYSLDTILNKDVLVKINDRPFEQMLLHVHRREKPQDSFICINSKTHLIEGCTSSKEATGSLYNQYIVAGNFFSLHTGEHIISSSLPCNEVQYQHRYY